MQKLTQEEVDALEEGSEVVIQYADKMKRKVTRKIYLRPDPARADDTPVAYVREVKPSGFPVWVRLSPIATNKLPLRMKVYVDEETE